MPFKIAKREKIEYRETEILFACPHCFTVIQYTKRNPQHLACPIRCRACNKNVPDVDGILSERGETRRRLSHHVKGFKDAIY